MDDQDVRRTSVTQNVCMRDWRTYRSEPTTYVCISVCMYYSIENVKTEQVIATRSLTFEDNQRAPEVGTVIPAMKALPLYVCTYVYRKESLHDNWLENQ